MKAKRLACLVILLLFSIRAAHAQSTVNFTAGPGERDVTGIDMTAVPDGNAVWLGFFSSGFDVSGNAMDLSALAAEWHLYGSTDTRSIFGLPGRFGATVSSSDPMFDGQKSWFWILQTTDNAAPQPNWSNVSAYGLFSSQAANWAFPAHDAIPPADMTSLSSSDVTEAVHGAFDPNHLTLIAVPEPSAFALVALGIVAFGLTARWRQRHN